ncbi:MAG: chemotaxis protein [unclassified Hahellaceae]|nr:chemotaxis protein [Hahellaceae bacterium]|tara:strand:- start:10368 stop:11252 length:885 start_codon:yes stop_codon:yes gene_type:complete
MTFEAHEYDVFRNFLERSSGIVLGDNKQYLVASRLRRILIETGVSSLTELVRRIDVRHPLPLREAVIDAMTTNETLWFRDMHPFNNLREHILPQCYGLEPIGATRPARSGPNAAGLANLASRQLRIWSAACSTGQEPYSIAMTLEQFRLHQGAERLNAKIVATDLSARVLDNAKEGRYDQLALGRGLDQSTLTQHFIDRGNGTWEVGPKLKAIVEFKILNLLDSFSGLGQFDIIFCRNVLIYFAGPVKNDILQRMHAALKPGGFLMLGASESPGALSDKFRMTRFTPGIAYQRI